MSDIPTMVAEPQHVRAAPPHSDPYPYYGRLARERKFFRDEVNGWWVAASAAAVNAVLTSELCLNSSIERAGSHCTARRRNVGNLQPAGALA